MRNLNGRLGAAILGTLLAANLLVEGLHLIRPAHAAVSASTRYKIVPYDEANREAVLNQYAKEGWELAAVEPRWGGFILEKQ